jgi:hypothetical protein
MSAGASTNPAEGSAPASAQVLTQSELEDRVAHAFIDSLDEADSEQPKRREAPQDTDDEAPDDESTEADGAEAGEPDADDEGDEPEPDAEDEDSASDDEEAEKPAKKQPGDDVTVKLDDGAQVTLRELKQGFLRQSDYTRKTQEIAATRKTLESERQTLTQAAQQQQQAFEVAAALIQEQMPPAPDVGLIQTNPQLYLQQQALREQALQKLQNLAHARQVTEQNLKVESEAKQREQAEELKRIKAEEHALLVQKLPKLREPKALEAFVRDAVEIGGRKWGITPEQIGNIFSHQEALILHAAINWEKSQSAKMKAVAEAKKAPPLRPAPRQQPGQRAKVKKAEALAVLKNPGSTEDARMRAAMASLPDDLF